MCRLLYMTYGVVLRFELLIQKRVQNEYIDNFTEFFCCSFRIVSFRKLQKKSKNMSNKVTTRYNLLPKRNVCRERFYTKKYLRTKQFFKNTHTYTHHCKTNTHSSFRSESITKEKKNKTATKWIKLYIQIFKCSMFARAMNSISLMTTGSIVHGENGCFS